MEMNASGGCRQKMGIETVERKLHKGCSPGIFSTIIRDPNENIFDYV